jgi:sugar phosphate isomerase/epimerase
MAVFSASLARTANRLPGNKNVKWALGSNLWNSFPPVPFTDILDIMRDTGFIGLRLTQFPQILDKYQMTASKMQSEASKRGVQVITISFSGPAHDSSQTKQVVADARKAMQFLQEFGAKHLVVFSPSRKFLTDEGFKTMCQTFNHIGEAAGEMGFRAGLHNHLNQMVENEAEVDRCMELTNPKLFWFSPDIAHLYLPGMEPAKILDRYKTRLMLIDYKDARRGIKNFRDSIFDFGDADIDFAACHRVLKSVQYKGWICADLDTARKGPRVSYERCGEYVVNKLEPIYV